MPAGRLRLIIALGTVYIVWGSTYLAIRIAVETLPPLLMASTRFLVAGGVLLAWRLSRGDSLPSRRQLRNSAIIGAALLLGGNGAVVIAETWVSSGLAALLVAGEPLFVVFFDWIRPRGERPSWGVFAGLALGLFGVSLLIDPASLGNQGTADLLGGLLILFAAASWAAGSVFARYADLPDSALMGSSTHMIFGGIWLFLGGLLRGEWQSFDSAQVSGASLWSLAYLIVFGSLVGFVAYSWLMRNGEPALVSTYAYVNPVIAVFLGWALVGEIVTLRTILAGLVVLSAVALISRHHQKKEPDSGSLEHYSWWRRRRRSRAAGTNC